MADIIRRVYQIRKYDNSKDWDETLQNNQHDDEKDDKHYLKN